MNLTARRSRVIGSLGFAVVKGECGGVFCGFTTKNTPTSPFYHGDSQRPRNLERKNLALPSVDLDVHTVICEHINCILYIVFGWWFDICQAVSPPQSLVFGCGDIMVSHQLDRADTRQPGDKDCGLRQVL